MLERLSRRIFCAESGNVAIIFGLAIPVLLGGVGFAIDAAAYYRQRDNLQSIADSSSLAAAKQLHLFRQNVDYLKEAGEARVAALIAQTPYASNNYTTEIKVDPDQNLIDVEVTMTADNVFPLVLGAFQNVSVLSRAQAYGQSKLCILGLDSSAPGTVHAGGKASVTAPGCAVHSNSTAPTSIDVTPDSELISSAICSSGGVGGAGSYTPAPQLDCPKLDDPLSSREPPPVSGCDYLDSHIDNEKTSISPGVYCGGLKITGEAEVMAQPGIYVFTGGNLEVKGKSSLVGDYVSFYFADDLSGLEVDKDTTIDFSAPKDGLMAGILMYESGLLPGRDFNIRSEDAKRLLGTIYLPTAKLKIDSKSDVAAESAYTVIVAQRVEVEGANLIVNSDYGGTDVPVPEGLGPHSTMSRLAK